MDDATTIRIERDLCENLKICAESEGLSIGAFANELLESSFNEYIKSERRTEALKKALNSNNNGYLLTVDQAAGMFNLGTGNIRKLAHECGAELKIGKSIRIDKEKLYRYLQTFKKE